MRGSKIIAGILVLAGIFSFIYIGSTIENFIKGTREATRDEASKIRVEILNGASIKGLAERVANDLQARGFDVLSYGNAEKKVKATVIFDRVDRELKNAKFVSRVLKQGKVDFEPHPLQLLEVTVVLGEDFKEKKRAGIIERK